MTEFKALSLTVLKDVDGAQSFITKERSEKRAKSIANSLNEAYNAGIASGIQEAKAYGETYKSFLASYFNINPHDLTCFLNENGLALVKVS